MATSAAASRVVDAVVVAAVLELGSASYDTVVAAALPWRVFYSIIPQPPGAIWLSRFHTANSHVLRHGTAMTVDPIGDQCVNAAKLVAMVIGIAREVALRPLTRRNRAGSRPETPPGDRARRESGR